MKKQNQSARIVKEMIKKYGTSQWRKFGTKRQNQIINAEIKKRANQQKAKENQRNRVIAM